MLTHGREELARLAASCVVSTETAPDGRRTAIAQFTPAQASELAATYDAVLLSEVDEAMLALLEDQGVPLRSYLLHGARDEITRSDATELAAAAALIRAEGWDIDRMHMPNVPKMSRAKSDSGLDVVDVHLVRGRTGTDPLTDNELLRIASVKHSVQPSSASCIGKLRSSLSSNELSPAYVGVQLRVLHARLIGEGYTVEEAGRVYLFLRELHEGDHLHIVGVAVVDTTTVGDARTRIVSALIEVPYWKVAVVIGIPDLGNLHELCSS
ncbi:hypothetical protein ACFWH7_03880 [Cellulosimicrobium cellulans]|uniref:hypothetical protein n=1 Tax=Cellulosimicrobium cellulans TaxID=1710 RepID=UPI00365E5415